MRQFRYRMRRSRAVILVNLLVTVFYATEGTHYTQAYAAIRQETERLEEISERMGIPVERLRRQQPGLLDAVSRLVSDPKSKHFAEQQARLEEVLRKHEEQVAANPYRDQIEAVKNESKASEIEGLLQDLSRLGSLEGARMPELSRKAMLRNLMRVEDEGALTLSRLPEGLPAQAYSRQREMQTRLDDLGRRARGAIAGPDPLPGRNSGGVAEAETRSFTGGAGGSAAFSGPESASRRIANLASTLNGEVKIRGRGRPGPRFDEEPLPLRRIEREAPVVAAPATPAEPVPVAPAAIAPLRRVPAARAPGASSASTTSSLSAGSSQLAGASAAATGGGPIAPEISDLAASLDNSPARIFRYVHDTIEYDPKWGQVRSPLGTLLERRGTSWDQAALLCELLLAAGVPAVLEWGEIEIPAELLLALTGTVDPADAGGVLATGGVPIVLQQIASQTVTARLDHVWVKAQLDYLPNRGVDPVTPSTVPDTWIRMDPSLKRYVYTGGIDAARNVPFALGDYLPSGTPLSPRRYYEEVLWNYIRANNITCTTLEQLKKKGTIVAEAFPYVPGTLRGKVLVVDGEDAAVPDGFRHRIRLAVTNDVGAELVFWETPFADTWGRRVEIAYQGATAADDAIIASFGGIFETPPYLVDLEPVIKVAGVLVAEGAAIGSARETEVRLTITETSGFVTPVSHETLAGEHHVLALDFGRLPQQVLDEHQALLAAALAAGDDFEAEAETLFLLGATYLANLGRDLDDLSGWTWQRIVKLGTEGLVSQRGDVTTTVGGAPLSFRAAERDVDFAKMTLGVFPADGDDNFKISSFELMGGQSSHLEGEVFNQVLAREGIASVSALTRSQREGQAITRVDNSNVGAVLAQINLDAGAEEAIAFAVSQGNIAWVAESPITVNQWSGTGYVLQDPATGAAGYLISGELAGGASTEDGLLVLRLFGGEAWLLDPQVNALLDQLVSLLGGPPSPDEGPGGTQGDPVNLHNGNFWIHQTDMEISAIGLPVLWTRTYNSLSDRVGLFGHGWSFSYGEHLEEQPDGSVLYRENDGTEHLFEFDAGTYVRPPGKFLTLEKSATEFTLRTKHGISSTFSLAGRLEGLIDPNGNQMTLGYDGSGDLETVTDAAGRVVLTIAHQGGRISQVTDFSGRTVLYGYTGDDLTSVIDTVGETWTFAYDPVHNLASRSDPLGNTHSYAYDSLDRCVRHTDPLGNEETFSYSSIGSSAVLTDRRGFETFFEFDERGRATLAVDPLGNTSSSSWDADNNRESTTDARGGTTARLFDGNGNLLQETDPLGATTEIAYDPVFNLVSSVTDALDHTVDLGYDTSGNVIEISQVVSGELLTEDFGYDPSGQLLTRVDARDNTTSFTWDPAKGVPASLSDKLGDVSLTTDPLGRLTVLTDAEGNERLLAWDDADRVSSLEDEFGNETSIVYDSAGRQTDVVSPKGSTHVEFDPAGRPIAVTDPAGHTTRTAYDPAGNVVERIDGRGNRRTFSYDAAGRLVSTTDALGNTWTLTHCAELGAGGPATSSFCEMTDPLGNTTFQEHDELGRVVRVTSPGGRTTRTIFDELGRQERVIDALDNTTRFEYDELGRLSAVVEENGDRTEYSYDGNGNLTNVRDAENHDWPRTYDSSNRLRTTADPLGNTTTRAYDALGNLESRLTPNGDLITFDYDVRRLVGVNLPGGAQEAFGYDPLGRRASMSNAESNVSFAYDGLDRLTTRTDAGLSQTLGYTYDAAGNLTEFDGPNGTVRYVYDALDRLVEQIDPEAGSFLYEYNALGRLTTLTYPNGVRTENEYDSDGRLLQTLTRDSGGLVLDGYTYTYDLAGNRVQMALLHETTTHAYEYDDLGRLTRWSRSPGRFEEYTYDSVGNRLTLLDDAGSTSYSYDLANRLEEEVRTPMAGSPSVTTFSWDANGNLLQKTLGPVSTSYAWDPLNRLEQLVAPSGTTGFGYDPDGIRVRETSSMGTRRFLHSFEDAVAVFDAGGVQTSYYAHGPGIDKPLAQLTSADGLSFLHQDGLGSVSLLTSVSGQVAGRLSYAAFGGVEAKSGVDSLFGFTARENAPEGLLNLRARYYDPSQGRLLSKDPFAGFLEDPISQNPYAYALDNPVNLTDPFGLNPATRAIRKFFLALALNIFEGMLGPNPLVDWLGDCLAAMLLMIDIVSNVILALRAIVFGVALVAGAFLINPVASIGAAAAIAVIVILAAYLILYFTIDVVGEWYYYHLACKRNKPQDPDPEPAS